jgi:hypothetical protein
MAEESGVISKESEAAGDNSVPHQTLAEGLNHRLPGSFSAHSMVALKGLAFPGQSRSFLLWLNREQDLVSNLVGAILQKALGNDNGRRQNC